MKNLSKDQMKKMVGGATPEFTMRTIIGIKYYREQIGNQWLVKTETYYSDGTMQTKTYYTN